MRQIYRTEFPGILTTICVA